MATHDVRQTWLGRNWRWLVVSCILLLIALGALSVWGFTVLANSNWPHQQAFRQLQDDTRAVTLLGEPMELLPVAGLLPF